MQTIENFFKWLNNNWISNLGSQFDTTFFHLTYYINQIPQIKYYEYQKLY